VVRRLLCEYPRDELVTNVISVGMIVNDSDWGA